MASSPPRAHDLQGFKYFQLLGPLLARLHGDATARDKAGSRRLHFDQYAALVLFYFFNPVLTSLNGLQQASALAEVQKALGCERTSVGALSAAARLFDPALLEGVIAELAGRVAPAAPPPEWEALQGLVAVDGSLLPALPRVAWALWLDEGHRAAKMHLHFEVLRGAPVRVSVTAGNGPEIEELRRALQPGRLYAIDRGYAEYQLSQDVIDAGSSFIGRTRDNAVWRVVEERPLAAAGRAAGVRRDLVAWLGSGGAFKQPVRVLAVETGKADARGRPEVLLLATDRLGLPAELVALGYRFRWAVELFFRWFKCILGCRHLLSTARDGVTIQVYLAVVAGLLLSVWTGHQPTKRTYEMFCLYFSGWATEEEVQAHIDQRNARAADTS
ncbi:MAG TPA: IS4 family transposase [Gemmataceae bacterium]|nr:IS4 family transposase [Gemmataceae bacterium]